MKLYHLSSGPLRVNSYFLVNEDTNECVVIDSGENYKKDTGPHETCLLGAHTLIGDKDK